ncbi:Biotin-lipoyl-2 domain-containing protein [Candidatus Ornithobacterium hominis]|uniref:biotin/lipoyl-binding protein n=1 Tax=Candidatus Ornithobacterium hominis TaxID=2497989 RepID=UPI0024BC99A0|nr:biotin/lipoyl-binding protein [Candidatus Ornithobacterium hominis]CAI9429844.1 Biotin-lipoyl-2 domain-containing protein [Candidatus Ornithobacterium hominis]
MKSIVYSTILIFIIGVIISLPIIKIPISTSARGIVRASQENIPISTMVSGRVIQNHLEKNNQNISKGDTLFIITAEQLDTQKQFQ